MWIIIPAILLIPALLVLIILLLPVKVILKNDEHRGLILRFKVLFKTFDSTSADAEPGASDSPIVKMLKTAVGADRFDGKTVKTNIQKDSLQSTVSDTFQTLSQLLQEVITLLQAGTVTKFNIRIVCAHEEPDEAAIRYGWCCAAASTLMNILRGFLKIRKRGCNVDIRCDFEATESSFRYDVVLSFPLWRVLMTFLRIVVAEAKRAKLPENQPK